MNDFIDEKSKVNPLKFQNVKCMTNLNGPKRKKVHYMSFVLVGFHLETITLQFSTLTLYQTTPFLKEMKEALYHDENSYNIILARPADQCGVILICMFKMSHV